MATKAEPELAKCRCGHSAKVDRWIDNNSTSYRVECQRVKALDPDTDWVICWIGPMRRTRRGAILAWNKVMERVHNGTED